jgi:HK97 family phage major capsid protein
MKSFKIVKSLLAILAIALTFAAFNLAPAEGALGMLIAAPIVLASIETSIDAKQKRKAIWDSMQAMIDTRKEERRDFSDFEQKKYNGLKKDFDQLTELLPELEADEKRALVMAGKALNEEARKAFHPSETWINRNTLQPVTVLKRDEKLVDHLNSDRRLSLGKAVQSLIIGDWSGAEAEQRALSTSSGSGLLVPVGVFAPVLDAARSKSICFQAGAKTVMMPEGKMTIARVLTDPEMQTKAQNDAFDNTNIAFDGIALNAFTVGGICLLSRELAQDAPNVAQAIETAMAGALAQHIDSLMLSGVGTTEPKGILHTVGVHDIDVAGDPLNYGHLLQAWHAIANANFDPLTIALNPLEMAALAASYNVNFGWLKPPDLLEKMQWMQSTAVPTGIGTLENESVGFMGDFSKLLLGVRSNAYFEVSTVSGDEFAKHQVAVKITMRVDVGVERPGAFAKLTDIQTPSTWADIVFTAPAG